MKNVTSPLVTLALLVSVACTSTENQPSATRSTTPSASATLSLLTPDDCPELTCQGRLEPGAYRSTVLDHHRLRDQVPGWTWDYWRAASGSSPIRLTTKISTPRGDLLPDAPPSRRKTARRSEEPGVGRSAGELVAWLESAPGLAVSEPTPVTVGGLDGVRLDLQSTLRGKRRAFGATDCRRCR